MSELFFGRDSEISQLGQLWEYKTPSLIACTGRRRIGKSSVVKYFTLKSRAIFLNFQGLAPRPGQTNQDQINNVLSDMKLQLNLVNLNVEDWKDLFYLLSEKIPTNQKTVLLLDEISWMGAHDPDFPGKLKSAWDSAFKQHQKLIIVLCGSVSSWIEKNILNNTGFVGRIRLNLRLEELPLKDTHAFWGANTKNISNEEKLKYISVTGSIPRYLEEIDARFSSEKNIERLAFNPSGILFNDFHSIFNDIFGTRSQKYKQIVSTLVSGPRSFEEICQKLKIEANGAITQYLQDLVEAGFLRRDYNFDFKGKKTKFSYFKLRDNYLRFYLKYIDPNHDKIKNQIVKDFSFESLINWPSILGLQFENTVLNNLNRVIELLKINSHEIISAGPYVQKKNAKNKGACQIDLLILTRFQTMYLCEIKFKKKVGTSIIAEVQKKINIFKRPKSFSIRPVLIYAGELEEEVTSSQFFNFTVSADDLMS